MSSSDYTAEDAIEDGSEGVEEAGGVGAYARVGVLGSALAAIGYAISDLILSAQSTLFAPIQAFVDGIATFIGGTLGAPVIITDAGAQASAQSFLSGVGAALGPFAFPLAVGVSVAGVWVFLYFLSNTSISPLSVLGDDE